MAGISTLPDPADYESMKSEERCRKCDGQIIERLATVDRPYQFKMSGLSNVYLAGIVIRNCTRCRAESPVIPKIGKLNDFIARDLVKKPALLTGEEIRFLRKNAGFPAKTFAELVGVDPKHLSRIENGHTDTLGVPADRLVRVIARAADNAPQPQYLALMKGLAAAFINVKKRPREPEVKNPIFELQEDDWKRAA